jgi:alkanesulfonate monooxygenase SsuD/methylene tetrahydromethanopterin reductase-like flavin-dependent oxidoreductase (luciferase family)
MRPFRFGVTMMASASRERWKSECRRAEDLGYDVISVADHLKYVAPFPAIVLAAEATERVQVGTFVLNAAFYNPTLLAREVATTARFTDGRLELGLGAGYVKAEFEAAGMEFPVAGKRIDHLEAVLAALGPKQTLLIGGTGDRMLTLAAKHADIIGFPGAAFTDHGRRMYLTDVAELAERVAFTREALGSRTPEFNFLAQLVEERLDPDHPLVRGRRVDELPAALIGSPRGIADRLLGLREQFGFSYLTVLEQNLTKLAPVIELLR